MINVFQLLYPNRQSIRNIQTEDEVKAIIHSELLDEFTHPRAKVIDTK